MSTTSPRGRGRPRKLPVDEQRSRVLAAARAVFAEEGVGAATIGRIAAGAGVSRQAVYEQFGDKEELFREVVNDLEERAARAMTSAVTGGGAHPDLQPWMRRMYRWMFDFAAENPGALAVLVEAERRGEPALTRMQERFARVFTGPSSERWAEYGVDIGRAQTALTSMYVGMTAHVVSMTWPDGARPDDGALIDLLTEFTLGGHARLLTPAGTEVIARLRNDPAGADADGQADESDESDQAGEG